jgi:hypothetical protein
MRCDYFSFRLTCQVVDKDKAPKLRRSAVRTPFHPETTRAVGLLRSLTESNITDDLSSIKDVLPTWKNRWTTTPAPVLAGGRHRRPARRLPDHERKQKRASERRGVSRPCLSLITSCRSTSTTTPFSTPSCATIGYLHILTRTANDPGRWAERILPDLP